MSHYSRRSKVEEKRNKKNAFLYILLSVGFLAFMLFYGLTALIKLSGFLADLRQGGEPVLSEDTTPPGPPRLDAIREFTNENKIEITGRTEASATVVIEANGKEDEVLAKDDGTFSYSFELENGKNTIAAYTVDSASNKSTKTDIHTIVFDNKPPEIEITNPQDGQEYFGTRNEQVTIEGKSEPEVSVTINDRVALVDNEGNFTFSVKLAEGENKFMIKAIDQSGNTTEKELTLHYTP